MTRPEFPPVSDVAYHMLKNRRPYRCGVSTWAAQQRGRSVVMGEDIVGGVRMETRFPGFNLGRLDDDGSIAWFETRFYRKGNPEGEVLGRYATVGEARRSHRLAVLLIGASLE